MILPETKQRAYTRFSSLIKQDTLRADNEKYTDIHESYMTRDISCCGNVTGTVKLIPHLISQAQ